MADNSLFFVCTKASAHTLQSIAMFSMRLSGETGEKAHSESNVQPGHNTCMHEFPWNISTGESDFFLKSACFVRLLGRPLHFLKALRKCGWQWHGWTLFFGGRSVPTMCLKDTGEVGFHANLDAVLCLENVETVAVLTHCRGLAFSTILWRPV